MELFEQNGAIYKRIPAGGHGGGVTGSVVVKASEAEAAAFHETAAAAEASPSVSAGPTISIPQADAEAIEKAVAKAVADATHEG